MDESLETIIQNYINEYANDVKINEERLREVELKVPGLKGKWSGRKAINLAKLYELKKLRDNYIENNLDKLINKLKDNGEIVTKMGAEKMLRNSAKMKDILDNIKRLEILCEFFESCEKNMQSMGFDVKNLVDTIKIDEM